MNIKKFVSSIYLGDRACKKIIIDSWSQEFCIEVDSISRVRSESGCWDFNSNGDVENGHLIFKKVKKVFFDKSGMIPNDQINFFDVVEHEDGNHCFTLSIDSVSDDGSNQEVTIKIIAEFVGIRDPLHPESLIID